MFKNPVSKIFIVLAVLTAALVSLSFVERSTPSNAQRSEPASSVSIPLPGNADLSDYFLRHSEGTAATASAGIPITAANELSDFFQRHTDWVVLNAARTSSTELSDYYQRFQAMKLASTIVDTSDYFLRHPASDSASAVSDTSDYFLRHP
jgi:hypothetical protein